MADDFMRSFRPAAAEDASFMRSFVPASTEADPAVVAHAASDLPSPAAARTIAIARETGTTPGYVAEDLPAAEAQSQKRQFEAQLRGRPALSAWASQSPQHAAAVRKDAGVLGAIEGWFSDMGEAFHVGTLDIMHAEAMREFTGKGGPLAEHATSFEAGLEEYERGDHGIPEHIMRAVPQMFTYGVAGRLGGMVGLGGLLYAQNKGVLARQIQLAQTEQNYRRDVEWLNQPEVRVVSKDGTVRWQKMGPEAPPDNLTPEEIDKVATAGSAVAAVTLAGLLNPLVRSLPGVRSSLQAAAASVIARAATTTVGAAALRGLSVYGQHTLMGALGMTLQAVINGETARMALKKDADIEQTAREATATFLKVLPVAAAFAAYGPGREFLEDRARINGSAVEQAKMDSMVKWAQESELVKHSPHLASDLFGAMGRGLTAYINHKAAAKVQGLDPAAVAEAAATQGDVAVPMADYLAHAADQHEAIRDDVKLSPNGYTMNEARFREKEMLEVLTPREARTLYGRLKADELQKLDKMPLAADMTGAFAWNLEFMAGEYKEGGKTAGFEVPTPERRMTVGKSGRQPGDTLDIRVPVTERVQPVTESAVAPAEANARTDTAQTPPLHEVMAQEYGGTAKEWAEKLSPELLEALSEEGSVGAISPEEHAARVIEATPIDQIDPAPFRSLAKKSIKYIQTAAEQARTGSVAGAKASSIKDVAVLQTHELARDVNLAKAKRAAEVSAELEAMRGTIAKQAVDNKLRASMALAGKPVLHLFDALTEGSSVSPLRQGWVAAHQDAVDQGAPKFSAEAVDYANERMSGALEEARAWFRAQHRPFEFGVDAVRDFLAKPKPWGELLPAAARNIADAVKQLAAAAKKEAKVRREGKEATVREAQEEISAELRQNPDKGLPLNSGIPSGWGRNRLLDANAANAVLLRYKNNLRQKSEAAMRWIYDRINDGVYVRDALYRELGGAFKAVFDEAPKEVKARRNETYDLSDKLPTPGLEPLTEVPRTWLWKMARHRMSAGNMDRVVSMEGWSKAVIDNILFDDPRTKLSVAEWDYLQGQANVAETIWGKLKSHLEEHYGMAPPKVAGVPFKVQLEDGTFKEYAGGYSPLKRERRPGVDPMKTDPGGIADYWGPDAQLPQLPGAAQDRVENSHYRVNMDWNSELASIQQTLHWLALDQPVRDVGKLLNDPALSSDMRRYMGEGRAQIIHDWVKTVATQQTQSLPEGMKVVGSVFDWNRRLSLMGIVGGSLRLAATQLEHPIGLMLGKEVPITHGVPALLTIFKPFEMTNGEVRLMPNWNDAIEHGRQVQRRADNAFNALREGFDAASPAAPGPIGALFDLARKTAGFYLHAVDRLTTTWAWTSFHNEAVAKGAEPFSKEAIAYADGRTEDVMPVHNIESAAPVLTNRQVGGFLIMHGFKNTLYNMRQDSIAKSAREFHLAETPGEYGSAIANAAGRVALQMAMFGGFAVMAKVVSGFAQQKDETKAQFLARTFMSGQTEDLPFVGGFGEPLAKLASGLPARIRGDAYSKLSKHDFTVFGNPGVAAVVKAQELFGSLVNSGREDYKKVFDAVEAALFLSGLPSRPPRVSAENLYKLVTGEGYDDAESTAGDKAARFVYTEKQWESVKRSLTPDEVD